MKILITVLILALASCGNKSVCQGTPLEIQICQQEKQIKVMRAQQAYQAQQIRDQDLRMQQQRFNAQNRRLMRGY